MANSIPVEFIEAAQSVHASPSVRINRRLGDLWEPGPGDVFLNRVLDFFRSTAHRLGNTPFALRLFQHQAPNALPLSAAVVTEGSDGKLRVYDVDQTLGVFSQYQIEIDDANESAQYLLQEASIHAPILYYLSKGCARLFAGKSLVFEFNPLTGGPVGTTHHFKRPSSEYEIMLREHYEEWVKHDQRTKHWHDRDKRTLREKTVDAKGTEEIFQISLWRWLSDYFSDRAQARIELRTEASDRTDIEVFPLFGGYFVIEIKWMGKNAKGTAPGIERIDDGLRQITQYINRGGSVRKATLVIYDGRSERQFAEIASTKDITEGVKEIIANVPTRGSAYVLFLFNKHASES